MKYWHQVLICNEKVVVLFNLSLGQYFLCHKYVMKVSLWFRNSWGEIDFDAEIAMVHLCFWFRYPCVKRKKISPSGPRNLLVGIAPRLGTPLSLRRQGTTASITWCYRRRSGAGWCAGPTTTSAHLTSNCIAVFLIESTACCQSCHQLYQTKAKR